MQQGIKNKLVHIKQKLAALFFLGCLLLAITPKQTLHELFADHTDDAFTITQHTTQPNLAKDTIHCHFYSLFTVNNFFYLETTNAPKPKLLSITIQISPLPKFKTVKHLTALLRGPPAADDFNLS